MTDMAPPLSTMNHLMSRLASAIMGKSSTMKPFTVVVEGNIGCGKTTFLDYFVKCPQVCILNEPVDQWTNCRDNNLLDLFYKNPKEYAFNLQSYVQLTMMKQHMKTTSCAIKLMERSLFSARYCFVEKLFREGILHPADTAVLDEWFQWIAPQINVDLIVYLRSSPEVAYKRVLERNRKEEKGISVSFLQNLHEYHENWLVNKTVGFIPAPVLTLNANVEKNVIESEFLKYDLLLRNPVAD